MDRAPDVIYLHALTEEERQFVTLIAQSRGIEVRPMSARAQFETTAICHRQVTYHGLWPVIDYLLDVFRYPDLLPETPEKRGVIRSLTEHLLARRVGYDDVIDVCEITGQLTMLDIAVIASAPATARHPKLGPLTRKILAVCRSELLAARSEDEHDYDTAAMAR